MTGFKPGDEVYGVADALKSFEHVMTGHARGKVVLDMAH
ncbi:MAG: hypothetical protein QOF91_3746 [Alphaproteobacteria bacterium]|nr:hypothetical protein [Alphaproteobacteria bacterium]MEA3028461.1 hypothetical protein [Alphaproteobacteria bacterium]